MARCWSCGSDIPGGIRFLFTCPNCETVDQIESLREEVIDSLAELARIQRHGFETLSDRLSEVATIIEWGFEEVKWQLEQQTDTLRSIDHTLKTPSETRANEWRSMAEELRGRGALEKALEFFLKACEANPIDYRIYMGLAYTYLEMNQFDKAKNVLEESIIQVPRVELPKKENYYRSYSYRLIGHIYACEENYIQAATVLKKAVELSPEYADAYYDYAQYCALTDRREDCLASLQKAVFAKPFCFDLAQKERNFTPFRGEVNNLLREHYTKVLQNAEEAISLCEEELRRTEEPIAGAEEVLSRCKGAGKLECVGLYEMAESQLEVAKDIVTSGKYTELLKVKDIVQQAKDTAIEAKRKADTEREEYQRKRSEERTAVLKALPMSIFGFAFAGALVGLFIYGIVGGIVGAITGEFSASPIVPAVIGAVIGISLAIYQTWKKLSL